MEEHRKEEKLEGWTKDQKFTLLEALQEVGSHDIEKIKNIVTNKTADEIKAALEFYKRKVSESPYNKKQMHQPAEMEQPKSNLENWAKFIADTYGHEATQTETSTALRLIAEFGDLPPPESTENIDFKKVYHAIADAMEDKPIVCDENIKTLLQMCLLETGITCKEYAKGTKGLYDVLLSACKPDEAGANTFFKPTEDVELSTLRKLISKKNYNPLNIPESYLKYSPNSK